MKKELGGPQSCLKPVLGVCGGKQRGGGELVCVFVVCDMHVIFMLCAVGCVMEYVWQYYEDMCVQSVCMCDCGV